MISQCLYVHGLSHKEQEKLCSDCLAFINSCICVRCSSDGLMLGTECSDMYMCDFCTAECIYNSNC